MDGRGGCCIARYAAGGAYDSSKINRIMLRFRPIAPKPATSTNSTTAESADMYVKTGRGKRRYTRNNSNGSATKRSSSDRKRKSPSSSSSEENVKTNSGGSVSGGENTFVTLPLLPETPDRKDSPARVSPGKKRNKKALPTWLSFGNEEEENHLDNSHVMSQVTSFGGVPEKMVMTQVAQPVRVVGTWVRVECVTDTWLDIYGLGRTDEDKFMNLERDTCPGFLSDGLNRVRWTNKAYKEMVSDQDEVVVWLVMKEGVKLPVTNGAFTCSVRLVACGGKEQSSMTLPCDVCRMECGGFAWRLDTKAALSLGR